jgi:large subunit ribosomal protein L32e
MAEKELLELRNNIKKKKPSFLRQDAHRIKRLKKKWVKPRGSDSKMRQGFKSYRRLPSVGFGSPSSVRGLSREGLIQKLISTESEIEMLDPKTDGAIVSRNVGRRKKISLVNKLLEKNITILNIKDGKSYLKSVEQEIKDQKAEKKKHKEEKEKKQKEKEKKAKKKEEDGLADKVEEEDKKKAEKAAKDKVITSKKE